MSLTLRESFSKPVDRRIDGVIKADDNRHLEVELDEYVLTNEVEKHLSKFLSEYNSARTIPSVWISGFFGSGKSHLLKILSLVLEAKPVGSQTADQIMLPKCDHDALLKGALTKAVGTASESILFNVDQKAQKRDDILSAFQLVFDEHCGYYGAQPHIAKFERDLDGLGRLQAFKERYQELSGKPWEEGRKLAALEGSNISKAYASASDTSDVPTDIISQYRKDYALSIEQFAEEVKAYIATKEKGFRLNFFVDEVGQFIADNVNLMTNLQTVAESLDTICNGQAWVIVTAQQDLEAVLGDLSALKQNDFSKIKGRLPIRLSLNSADVAEVIQKRLLDKKETAKSSLHEIYKAQQNNFDTLFRFGDGTRTYDRFKDSDHFVSSYPFIPYQYDLFSEAIKGLSRHGAFQGRFSSVGERSMLAVFQEVAKEIADLQLGQIAPFDRMFDGLKASLTAEAQNSITLSERTLVESPMASRVLKSLFLVKYVDGFKASLSNIAILLRESFEQNTQALRDDVAEALALLESQSFIQREGEFYDFLTDEEKDVEKEIKDVDIDQSEMLDALNEILFSEVISTTQMRHETSRHSYPFARMIDRTARGKDQELKIHILSPFETDLLDDAALASESAGSDAVLVRLSEDARFVGDMRQYLKTQKYVRQNQTSGNNSTRDKIVLEKGEQNRRRRSEIKKRAEDLIRDARFYVRGALIDAGSGDAKAKIERAFSDLIDKVYTNLRLLRGNVFSETDLLSLAVRSDDDVIDTEVTEAEADVLKHIERRKNQGLNVRVSEVIEHFEKAPYGWPYPAILCQIAGLVGRGRVEARLDSDILSGTELAKEIRARKAHAQITLQPQREFGGQQVKALKTFYDDFFGKPLTGSDPKTLGEQTREAFDGLAADYRELSARSESYPFKDALTGIQPVLTAATGKAYDWYLTELSAQETALFDAKEKTLDPIKRFMEGPQRGIFDSAKQFYQTHRSHFDSSDPDIAALSRALDDPQIFSSTNGLKTALDALQSRVGAQKDEALKTAMGKFETYRTQIEAMSQYSGAAQPLKDTIKSAFDRAIQDLKSAQTLSEISDSPRWFKDTLYPGLVKSLLPKSKETDGVREPGAETLVQASSLYTANMAAISTEAELDAYLNALKAAYSEAIKSGKRIML